MNYGILYERLNDFGYVKRKGGLVLPVLAEGQEEDEQVVKQILQQVSKDFPGIKQAVVRYNGKTYHCVKGPGGGMSEINEGFFMKLVLATLLLAAGGWIGAMLLTRRKKRLKVLKVDKKNNRILVDFQGKKQWLTPTDFHNLDPTPVEESAMESLVGQDLPYLPFMPLYMREDCTGWTALPAGAEMTVVSEDKQKLTVDVDGEDYYIPRNTALDAHLDHVKETYSAKQQARRWAWTKEERVKLVKSLAKLGNVVEQLVKIGQTTKVSAERYLDWLSEDFDQGLMKGIMAQDPRFKSKNDKKPTDKPPVRKPVDPQNRDRKIVQKANGTNKKKGFYRPLGGEEESVDEAWDAAGVEYQAKNRYDITIPRQAGGGTLQISKIGGKYRADLKHKGETEFFDGSAKEVAKWLNKELGLKEANGMATIKKADKGRMAPRELGDLISGLIKAKQVDRNKVADYLNKRGYTPTQMSALLGEQGPLDPDHITPGKRGRGAGWSDIPKAFALHFDPEDLPEMKCGCPGPGACIDEPDCPCPDDCPCKQPVEAISESAIVNYYYWYARYHEPSSHYNDEDKTDEDVTEDVIEHIMEHGAKGLLTEFYGSLGNSLVRLGSTEPGQFDKRSRYYRQFEKQFRRAYKKVYREAAPDHVLRRVFKEWLSRGRNVKERGNLRTFVRSRTAGMPSPQMMGIARG